MILLRVTARIYMMSLVSMLAACSGVHLDEGAINYRKTPPAERTTSEPMLKKYHDNNNAENRITSADNDTIAVYLQQAFIADFHEEANPLRGEQCPPSEGDEQLPACADVRGEIAIVARVFELNKDKDFLFKSDTARKGRVIYYGDDVRKYQFLNLSYLPIYGPIKYNGRPLGIQLYIIEIDQQDEKLTSLLSTLASIGTTALAPSSNVLAILDTLGSSLIADSGDDIHFKYSATLMPYHPSVKGHYPILESGHYVFLRRHDRRDNDGSKESNIWNSVYLDREEGRLRTKENIATESNACIKEPHTLFIGEPLQITKNKASLTWSHQETATGYLHTKKSTGSYTFIRNTKIPCKDCNTEDYKVYPLFSNLENTESNDVRLVDLFPNISMRTECPLYTKETYLTLHITEGYPATELNISETLYGALRDSLAIDEENALNIEQTLNNISTKVNSEKANDELLGYYQNLENKSLTKPATLRYTAQSLVDKLKEYAAQNNNARNGDEASPPPSPLSDAQIEELFRKTISLIPMEKRSGVPDNLDEFKTATKVKTDSFIKALIDAYNTK